MPVASHKKEGPFSVALLESPSEPGPLPDLFPEAGVAIYHSVPTCLGGPGSASLALLDRQGFMK